MQKIYPVHRLLKQTALALIVALPCVKAMAVDREVGASKTYATIQDALNAATAGTDKVVVFNGTYDFTATFNWNKAVSIVAAPGEDPVVRMNMGFVGTNVDMFGNTGPVEWDGIDVQIVQYETTQGIFFNQVTPTVVTFKNMSITDVGATGANPSHIFTIDSDADLTLDNVTINNQTTAVFSAVNIRSGANAHVLIKNSTLEGKINTALGMLLQQTANCRMDVVNTTVTATAGTTLVQHSGGSFTATDSRFLQKGGTIGGAAGVSMAYWAVSASTSATLTRTIFDTRNGGNRALSLRGAPLCNLTMENCVFLDDWRIGTGAGTPVIMRTESSAGTVTVDAKHCTFSSIDGSTNTLQGIQIGTANANPQTFNLVNNLFYLPGTAVGALATSSVTGNSSGTLTVNAGTNLSYTAAGTPGIREKLNGTIVTGNPNLNADFYHLVDPSPAMNAGVPAGVVTDIDGQTRPIPVGSNPELGADETYYVPVEVSGFSVD